MKKIIPVILLLLFLSLNSFNFSKPCVIPIPSDNSHANYKISTQLNDGILVGRRTGDNTAELSISKSDIQQNILVAIQELNGASVTDDPISIHISPITSYLLFKITNTAGEKKTIAIELVSAANDLLFQANTGREIHYCQSTGSCSSCEFGFDLSRIIGCSCNASTNPDSSANANCQHIGKLLN